jgi:predicted N-acetyltransferase YhbS
MDLRRPCGPDYLSAVTDLLHDVRRGELDAGQWEAADAQWWYPRDTHPQPDAAAVWYADDRPVSAAVFTRWSAGLCGADVFGDHTLDDAWHEIDRGLDARPDADVDMAVAAENATLLARARTHGFVEETERLGIGRAEPADLVPAATLPAGFRVVARPDLPGPHPLSVRNGAEVEGRLHDCSLYDSTCDLALVTDTGQVAGYALFWPDPVTSVGLVEPVRVEDAYAGLGLATALVRTGLRRLAERGCRHFKVCYGLENPGLARLYERAGFTERSTAVILRRPKRRPDGSAVNR